MDKLFDETFLLPQEIMVFRLVKDMRRGDLAVETREMTFHEIMISRRNTVIFRLR